MKWLLTLAMLFSCNTVIAQNRDIQYIGPNNGTIDGTINGRYDFRCPPVYPRYEFRNYYYYVYVVNIWGQIELRLMVTRVLVRVY